MASIHDVARATGVSTATVSRALRGFSNVSEKTRRAVERAALDLGYVASSSAAGLATGRQMAIGVVVPVVGRWFYTSVLDGVDSELRPAGYDLILFSLGGHGGERTRLFHRSMLRKRIDALIALSIDFADEEKEQFASLGLPVFAIGGPVRGVRSIGIDDRETAKKATEYLLQNGHRRIAFMGGDDEDGFNTAVPRSRRRGFVDTMTAAGLPVPREWLMLGEFDIEVSRAAFTDLIAKGGTLPTAVFSASDRAALGVIRAARDAGLRVPDDISVIGVDNDDMAEFMNLTTMGQDPTEHGALAARLLLGELAGNKPRKTSIRFQAELIERGSVARLPG